MPPPREGHVVGQDIRSLRCEVAHHLARRLAHHLARRLARRSRSRSRTSISHVELLIELRTTGPVPAINRAFRAQALRQGGRREPGSIHSHIALHIASRIASPRASTPSPTPASTPASTRPLQHARFNTPASTRPPQHARLNASASTRPLQRVRFQRVRFQRVRFAPHVDPPARSTSMR
jgi:hypothetical protein